MLAALLAVALCGCGPRATPHAPLARQAAWQTTLAQARVAERARQHLQARQLYQTAERQADSAQARAEVALQFAETLLSWEQFADAEAQLQRVVANAPNVVAAWHDLGMVRFRLGLPAGAEVAFRRAITLAPTESRPRIALAAMLWTQHRAADALREYQGLQALPLPDAVATKVAWAIKQLTAAESR